MTPFFILGVVVGALVAWAITKCFYDTRRKSCVDGVTDQMERSMTVQEQLHTAAASGHLRALRALEAGDYQTANLEIASGIAFFYNLLARAEHSEGVRSQMRDIELQAKKSEVLRAALEQQR